MKKILKQVNNRNVFFFAHKFLVTIIGVIIVLMFIQCGNEKTEKKTKIIQKQQKHTVNFNKSIDREQQGCKNINSYVKEGFISFNYPEDWTIDGRFNARKIHNKDIYTHVVHCYSSDYETDNNYFVLKGSFLEIRKEELVNSHLYVNNPEALKNIVYGNFKYYKREEIREMKDIKIENGTGITFKYDFQNPYNAQRIEARLISNQGIYYKTVMISKDINIEEVFFDLLSTFKFID